MNIESIALRLNELLDHTAFADFQRRRSERLNKKCGSLAVFSAKTIHDDYAYHHGGRREVQFNIGLDYPDVFRFGIALSLEKDITVTDPVAMLGKRFEALNSYLAANIEQFAGLKMWRWYEGRKYTLPTIQCLPDSWLTAGSFVFIGSFFVRPFDRDDLSNRQYQQVVRVLEQLLDVYQHVESSVSAGDEFRAARIVWNEAGWIRPTGPLGKVKNRKNYEHIHGFGHEEWLFDLTKQVEGWKYGFLQTFHHNHKTYQRKKFDTLLYSINSATKKRYWIARISNIECITAEQAELAFAALEQDRFLEKMARQVDEVGGDPSVFDSAPPLEIINCRFREEDLQIFGNDDLRPELEGDVIKAFYYDTFTKLDPEFFYSLDYSISNSEPPKAPKDLTDYDASGVKAEIAKYNQRISDEEHVDLRHKQWQMKMLQMLREKLGVSKVGMEVPMGTGNADLYLADKNRSLIIEVKTGHSTSNIIREAFGQLLEYAYWPGVDKQKVSLAIVGTPRLDIQSQKYIEFIRKKFDIPISYVRWKPHKPDVQGIVEIFENA